LFSSEACHQCEMHTAKRCSSELDSPGMDIITRCTGGLLEMSGIKHKPEL
jgi:hypothetical protein